MNTKIWPYKMDSEKNISQSEVLAKAVLRIAEQLQLKESELAMILGSSDADLSLAIKEHGLAPNTTQGERALALVRIYEVGLSLHGGDVESMLNFINSPNRLLNHQVPRTLLQTEHGLTEVLQLVEGLQQR